MPPPIDYRNFSAQQVVSLYRHVPATSRNTESNAGELYHQVIVGGVTGDEYAGLQRVRDLSPRRSAFRSTMTTLVSQIPVPGRPNQTYDAIMQNAADWERSRTLNLVDAHDLCDHALQHGVTRSEFLALTALATGHGNADFQVHVQHWLSTNTAIGMDLGPESKRLKLSHGY